MTDREKLRKELEKGKEEYSKRKTICKLMGVTNVVTGNLPDQLYIPVYDVDEKFLLKLLAKLGYHYECKEEYNPFFEQCCLKVKLSKP